MKRKSLLFLLLFALLAPWAAQAQETLTVYDGTATNPNVPFYSLYADYGARSQFIIPAEQLASMVNGSINKLTFYSSYTATANYNQEFTVYVKEVDYTTFESAALVDWGTMTPVYTGTLTLSGQQMEVPMDYTYEGSNLMIGFQVTSWGSTCPSLSWYGENQASGSYTAVHNRADYSHTWQSTVTRANFLPKTTFTYEPGSTGGCERPETLVPSDVTATSATLTWTGGSGTYNVEIQGGSYTDWSSLLSNTDLTTTDLADLDPTTTYSVRVQSVCEGVDPSGWKNASFTTPCGIITSYPWFTDFDSYTGTTSGSANNLPDCWNYYNGTTYTYYAGYPLVYNGSSYSYSGNNHLRLYSTYYSYYTYTPQYAILPEMANLNGKQLTLYARGVNTNSSFTVGMMTDPEDISTFVAITTTTPTTSYAEYTYDLTDTGNYIAIKMDAANSSVNTRGVYIDDIRVDNPPTCIKPTNLTVSEVAAHNALLKWVPGAEGQTEWQICLNDDENNLIRVIADTAYLLPNLTADTAYTVKIRAYCNEGDQSYWSNQRSFTTTVPCPTPTNFAVIDTTITNNSATVKWTGYPYSENYTVYYKTAAYTIGLDEHFDASTLPSDWTIYNGAVNDVVAGTTELSAVSGYWNTNSIALGAYNVKLNIYGGSCKYWLVSPEVNLVDNAALNFDLALTDYGNADPSENVGNQADDRFVVLVYADSVWTILREWNNTGSENVYDAIPNTGTHVSIDLSAYNGENVKIAFYGESTASGGDNDMHIDNVGIGVYVEAGELQSVVVNEGTSVTLTDLNAETLYEAYVQGYCGNEDGLSNESQHITFTTNPDCVAPSNLRFSNITSNSVTLSWTEGGTATQWVVSFKKATDETYTNKPVRTNPYTITGLHYDTEYNVRVRPTCDAEGWSTVESFTTLEKCPTPTDLSIADSTINGHGATMNWVGNCESYNVGYRTASYLNGIEEQFGTSLPAGWENKSGLLSNVMSGTALTSTSQWYFGNANGVFDNHARINIYGETRYGWLITPAFTVNDGFVLDFDLALTDYYSSNQVHTGTCNDDRFVVLVTTDNEATWTILREWNNAGSEDVYNNIAVDGEAVSIDFSAYAGQTVRIAFYGESTTSGNGDNNLHIDNVAIGVEVPAGEWVMDTTTYTTYTFTGLDPETLYDVMLQGDCAADSLSHIVNTSFTTDVACKVPTNLIAFDSTLTAHSVVLQWEENGEASAWQIWINNDTVPMVDADTTTFMLANLDPETTYTVKVRANCGDEDGASAWSNTVTFTTLEACPTPTEFEAYSDSITAHSAVLHWTSDNDNFIMEYREFYVNPNNNDFENGIGNWTTIDADGDGYDWKLGSSEGNFGSHTGADCVVSQSCYGVENDEGGTDWIPLTPDNYLVSPQIELGGSISFWACGQDANFVAEHFGVAVSTTGNTDAADFTTIAEWTMAAKGAGAKSAVTRSGNRAQGNWYPFTVDLSEYAGSTGYVAIRHFGSTDMFYLDVDDIVIDEPNAAPWTSVDNVTNPYTLTDLIPETTYEVQMRSDCGDEGYSHWVYTTFTTGIACFAPTALEVSAIGVDTVLLSWTDTLQTAWQICLNDDMNTLIDVDENPYVLRGLAPDSTYTVKVRANCGSYDGYSQWSNAVTFTTLELCLTPTDVTIGNITGHTATMNWTGYSDNYIVGYRIPAGINAILEEHFTNLTSGIPTGWDNSEGTTTYETYKWSYYNSGHEAVPCLRFNSYFNSNGYTNFLKTPSMDFPENTTMILSFWWKNPTGGNFSVYISTDGGTTKTALVEGLTSQSSWKQETIALTDYAGVSNVTIHFKGTSNYGNGDAYIYLDDVVIGYEVPAGEWTTDYTADTTYTFTGLDPETIYEALLQGDCGTSGQTHEVINTFTTDIACHAPVLFAVADTTITTTGATLTWTGDSPAYKLSYRVVDAETWEELTVDGTTYTFTNLTPATMYEAKVQGDCGEDGLSEESNTVSFTTLCEIYTITARTPYFQDFESPVVTSTYSSITGAMLPVCWGEPYTTNTNYTYAKPHTIAAGATYNYANSGQVLYFYGSGYGYAALPEFTNELSELFISFKYATESSSHYGTLTLGYITEEDENYNTFTTIQDFPASADNYHVMQEIKNVDLSNVPANATRLVFCWYYTGQWACNIDDVKVTLKVVANKEITGYGENNDKWYLIANPLEEAVNPAEIEGMIPTISDDVDYDLYIYEQVTPADFEWQNYKNTNGFDLVNGMGYLYARKTDTVLTFVGAPYSGNGAFPLVNNADAFAPGWNLLGNPYAENASISRNFYKMNADGNEIIAATSGSDIAPMEGIFVYTQETNDTVVFYTVGGNNAGGAGDAGDPFEFALNLNAGNTLIDRVIIRFGEGRQLPKLQLNENSSSLCIPQNGSNYAVVTTTGNGEMPVNFKAEKAGTYTISFSNENVNFSYLHLIDNVTHTEVDLLGTLSYSFETQAGNFANRFTIVYEVK